MDPIKEAFQKAKQDIQSLKSQIESLQFQIQELKSLIQQSQQADKPTDRQKVQQIPQIQQTNQQETPTDKLNELHNLPLNDLISPISIFSTGNEGVPTNRQTNQQTNRQTTNTQNQKENGPADRFPRVSELLESLDSIKKEVRVNFKKLTKQEMLVFATIYQLEEQGFVVDYPLISQKLKLSESSIRDYTQRIIKKGIPLQKTKENNKKVSLNIAQDLKKIASLSTILQLREL